MRRLPGPREEVREALCGTVENLLCSSSIPSISKIALGIIAKYRNTSLLEEDPPFGYSSLRNFVEYPCKCAP